MISFGENDRSISASVAGPVCLCDVAAGETGPFHDLELCEECHDPSPLVLGYPGGKSQNGIRAGVFLDPIRLENSPLPEGPFLDEIEPPLI